MTRNNELAVRETGLTVMDLPPEKVELLKRTMCKGATDDELELFLHACKHTGLDPFVRQIYAVKRKQRNDNGDYVEVMTIQTGIDGYRLIAERTGRYMPGREPTFTYNDNGLLLTATAHVKKLAADGSWHEISATAHWDEYVSLKRDNKPTRMWNDKPHIMLSKCAESLALRRAFPAELSGVYTREEMEQAEPSGEQPENVTHQVASRSANGTPPANPAVKLATPAQLNELAGLVDELKITIEESDQAKASLKVSSWHEVTEANMAKVLAKLRKRKEAESDAQAAPADDDSQGDAGDAPQTPESKPVTAADIPDFAAFERLCKEFTPDWSHQQREGCKAAWARGLAKEKPEKVSQGNKVAFLNNLRTNNIDPATGRVREALAAT
jgi:phage recombination protein Bet